MKFTLIIAAFFFAQTTLSRTIVEDSLVIMVQPIIVQGDDGMNPAPISIPEDFVDNAYSRAKIDFVFLEPIYYNNSQARDGEISLDKIVSEAKSEKILRGNNDIINVFFVNKVDGKTGPLGRGLFGGNITFIALGDSNTEDVEFMEAFVMIHEVGHNLKLKHAVDDPNVPDSLPNIQGDGSYEDRINPKNSLNDYQINLIHQSPLVIQKIDFLSQERGQIGILDESFEAYFSNLQEREIYAFTQEWSNTDSIEAAREFAREKFKSAVTEFSNKEKDCIKFVIKNIDSILARNNISLFKSLPWRFIKIEDWLCGGFAHTRGTYTILSQKYLTRYTDMFGPNMSLESRNSIISNLGALLIHEQVHALQRMYPSKFKDLYENYWKFEEVDVEHDLPELITNQLLNPDAPDAKWIYHHGKKSYWVRVLLNGDSENPKMGKDFTSIVYDVQLKNGKYRTRFNKNGKPKIIREKDVNHYIESFPITTGVDHPNEISAYMYAEYFKALSLQEIPFSSIEIASQRNTELFIDWLVKKNSENINP